jgi:hypothetical protein
MATLRDGVFSSFVLVLVLVLEAVSQPHLKTTKDKSILPVGGADAWVAAARRKEQSTT